MVVLTLLRKNDLLKHAQHLSTVLTVLVLKVHVVVVIHQADPLLDVVENSMRAHAARPAAHATVAAAHVVRFEELPVFEDFSLPMPTTRPVAALSVYLQTGTVVGEQFWHV